MNAPARTYPNRAAPRYWTEEERAICMAAAGKLNTRELADLLVDRPPYLVGDYCRYIGVKLVPVNPPKPQATRRDPGPKSAWNDEREARATKLWKAGHSASQIARDLACGMSRNAVIGKLHRLGVANRPAAASPMANKVHRVPPPPKRPPAPVRPFILPTLGGDPSTMRHRENIVTNAQVRAAPPSVAPEAASGPVVALLDLKFHHCRWPLGEPNHDGFGFCGADHAAPSPYCAKHQALACIPTVKRKGGDAKELARSLRRYI